MTPLAVATAFCVLRVGQEIIGKKITGDRLKKAAIRILVIAVLGFSFAFLLSLYSSSGHPFTFFSLNGFPYVTATLFCVVIEIDYLSANIAILHGLKALFFLLLVFSIYLGTFCARCEFG
jgi:hypothetical protein